MSVIPEEDDKKKGSTLSFWADETLSADLRKAAADEGLSPSKFIGHLVRAGWKQYLSEKRKPKK